MITKINFETFNLAFSHRNNFTHQGKRALFDYLEQYE